MSDSSSAVGKLTERTPRMATRDRRHPLFSSIASGLLRAHDDSTSSTRADAAERHGAARQGQVATTGATTPNRQQAALGAPEHGQRLFELRGSPFRTRGGGGGGGGTDPFDGGGGGSSSRNAALTKRKPVPPIEDGREVGQQPAHPQPPTGHQFRPTDEATQPSLPSTSRTAAFESAGHQHHHVDASHRHNKLLPRPADLLASPQHAPAGKEQLLMRLANSNTNLERHNYRARRDDNPSQSQRESSAERHRAKNKGRGHDKSSVFSLSDAQLAARYNFVREFGFGEWGSIWAATPVKDLEHLPSSAYPQITTRKLNGVGYVKVENPNHRPLAIKVCTRERNSQSSARTERLWHEFKTLRALIDAPSSTDGDTSSGSSSASRSPPRRAKGDRIFGQDWHTSIVKFYEFVVTPSIAMIVMPCYDEPMKVGLPEERCRAYFQQLLSGLFWLHQRGACHNDIKVANMLVNYDGFLGRGTPILVDFGFATLHDQARKDAFMTRASWGTPEYLAPERARGDLHDERASDVWSLGVTFFEIAATRTPFEEQDEEFVTREQLQAYYHRTMSGVWVGSWDVPTELEDLVRRMLTPAPADRIDAADALLHPYFDPASNSFDNSLEDILDMFPSDDEDVTRGGGVEDARSDHSNDDRNDNDGRHRDHQPSHEQSEGRDEINRSEGQQARTGAVLRGQLEPRTHLQAHRGAHAGAEGRARTPPSPTLSAMTLDAQVPDLAASTPPWKNQPVGHRGRAAPPARSRLVNECRLDADGDHSTDSVENTERPVVVGDGSTPTHEQPRVAPLVAVDTFGQPEAAATATHRAATIAGSPVAAAHGSSQPRLVPRELRTPLRAPHLGAGGAGFALPRTPAKQQPLRPYSLQPVAFKPGADSKAVLQGPRTADSPRGARGAVITGADVAARQPTGTPRSGVRKVASLAKRFDAPNSAPTEEHARPLSLASSTSSSHDDANAASSAARAERRRKNEARRGHGRSKSDTKAIQTDMLMHRQSFGVQVGQSSLGAQLIGGGVEHADKVGTDLDRGRRDSPEHRSAALHRSGSVGSSLSDHNWTGPATTKRASTLLHPPGGPTIKGEEVAATRKRASFHRRTRTDLTGASVKQKLDHMGAIAEALTRLIGETRSSLPDSDGSSTDEGVHTGSIRHALALTMGGLEPGLGDLDLAKTLSFGRHPLAQTNKLQGGSQAPADVPLPSSSDDSSRDLRLRVSSEINVTRERDAQADNVQDSNGSGAGLTASPGAAEDSVVLESASHLSEQRQNDGHAATCACPPGLTMDVHGDAAPATPLARSSAGRPSSAKPALGHRSVGSLAAGDHSVSKRFGFAKSLRRPRSLASMFSPRSLSSAFGRRRHGALEGNASAADQTVPVLSRPPLISSSNVAPVPAGIPNTGESVEAASVSRRTPRAGHEVVFVDRSALSPNRFQTFPQAGASSFRALDAGGDPGGARTMLCSILETESSKGDESAPPLLSPDQQRGSGATTGEPRSHWSPSTTSPSPQQDRAATAAAAAAAAAADTSCSPSHCHADPAGPGGSAKREGGASLWRILRGGGGR